MDSLPPQTLSFALNGTEIDVEPTYWDWPLIWFIRDHLHLKGTKFGCGHGGCGACMVQIDGAAATSCNRSVKEVAGKRVATVEYVTAGAGNPTVRAWLSEQVPQCGYCQPAMVVAADALLAENKTPTDADIDRAMSHVLCRCGTYPRVRRATIVPAHGRGAPHRFLTRFSRRPAK